MATKIMSDAEFKALMTKARRTNRVRDASELKVGFATPNDGPLSFRIRTVMSAIQCGIKINDPNALAEGLAMLEIIELSVQEVETALPGGQE